ncbi:hypothetical protein [Peptoniphilus asaccharolyticus]
MNLRRAKELIYNGNKHSRAYFNGRLVWQKLKPGEFAKDFKYLESSENFEGIWDRQKGALIVYAESSSENKMFNKIFTRKVNMEGYWFKELNTNTFELSDWIRVKNTKVNSVYLLEDRLYGRLDFYYKKDDGWYTLRQKTLNEFKEMIGGTHDSKR